MSDSGIVVRLVGVLVTFAAAMICLLMWGCPQYNVYSKRQSGMAQLAEAESNRQITIQEAKAKEESAKFLAQAEILRAEGIAKANGIIGQSLEHNHAYLAWLWIEALQNSKNSVIYIPTEANIPLLEASRFNMLREATPPPEKP